MNTTITLYLRDRTRFGEIAITGENVAMTFAKGYEDLSIAVRNCIAEIFHQGLLRRTVTTQDDIKTESVEHVKCGDKEFYPVLCDELNRRDFGGIKLFAICQTMPCA